MDSREIRAKYGDDYVANDTTFMMGVDQRFSKHIAARFRDRKVLETCTGAGFCTIALAREATHVTTVEIEPRNLDQARINVAKAGLQERVTFLSGDVLDDNVLGACSHVDAALLDPDWAVTWPDHIYRFKHSNTLPPANVLLERILALTPHVALILPPKIDVQELEGLPAHERQELYLDDSHELYCLYFGDLAVVHEVTKLRR